MGGGGDGQDKEKVNLEILGNRCADVVVLDG